MQGPQSILSDRAGLCFFDCQPRFPALRFLRMMPDVSADIEEMETECTAKEAEMGEEIQEDIKEEESYTMRMLLATKELRMPLLIAVMLQIIQQFSGINAVCIHRAVGPWVCFLKSLM